MIRRAFFLHMDGRSFAAHDGPVPLNCIECWDRESIPREQLDEYVVIANMENSVERVVLASVHPLPRLYYVSCRLSSRPADPITTPYLRNY